jgi:hypothetical protein
MASLKPGQGLELLKTGLYSDLTLACAETEFKIHKALVCPQSEFFSTCVKASFKEGQESRIELQETHPGIVALALLFMYTGGTDFDLFQQIWKKGDLPAYKCNLAGTKILKIEADLFQLADRLMLPDLQTHACDCFKKFLREGSSEWIKEDKTENRSRYLTDILQHVYQVTRSDDTTLRYEATVFVLEVVLKDKKAYEMLGKVLEEHEPMTWKVVSGAKGIRF